MIGNSLPPASGHTKSKYIYTTKVKGKDHYPCCATPEGRIALGYCTQEGTWIYYKHVWILCSYGKGQTGGDGEHKTKKFEHKGNFVRPITPGPKFSNFMFHLLFRSSVKTKPSRTRTNNN